MAVYCSRRLLTNGLSFSSRTCINYTIEENILKTYRSIIRYRSISTTCFCLNKHRAKRTDPWTADHARKLIYSLDSRQRVILREELTKLNGFHSHSIGDGKVEPPTLNQLRYMTYYSGIPFIGFGFLDNLIMIIAGEYIDVTLGVMLGISTMAAAALGNLVSDLVGVGCAGYIEIIGSKLGMLPPDFTPQQLDMKETRWAAGIGRSVGICIGCLLGMLPLLFYDSKHTEAENKDDVK